MFVVTVIWFGLMGIVNTSAVNGSFQTITTWKTLPLLPQMRPEAHFWINLSSIPSDLSPQNNFIHLTGQPNKHPKSGCVSIDRTIIFTTFCWFRGWLDMGSGFCFLTLNFRLRWPVSRKCAGLASPHRSTSVIRQHLLFQNCSMWQIYGTWWRKQRRCWRQSPCAACLLDWLQKSVEIR